MSTVTIGKPVTVATGRAFTGTSQWGYVAKVTADGDVLVYDDVARHYTRCHSLTAAQIRYVLRIWERQNWENRGQ